ncbi:hypothetical protein D1831_07445 [Lactiplantibacillus garii]|uniref:Integral membrane protein n=1 Tax=Lactiplantibacillus garii TaxID=2306423 RepID=A0A3R8KIE3_9LACO|nr:hypothetical protein [Lactiplantibacillus garii]RRK10488.1 hypothetical protein D1831_07445 [Lactiplantibacillus garii]
MNRVLKGINWLAAGVLGWAGLVAWLQPVNFFGDPDLASPVVIGSFTLAFLILVNALRQWMRRWSSATYRRVVVGLLILIAVTQLVVAVNFVDVSRADAFYVRTQALTLARGDHTWMHYFAIYPNNVNFTLLEATLIKVVTTVVSPPWTVLNVLRFLWVDSALFSGLYLLRHWHHARPGAVWLAGFWLVSPPVYSYALYAYTDALVLPMVLNCLALMTWALGRSGWRRWGGLIAAGLLLAVGVAMKSNLVVFWIATLLLILVLWQQRHVTWQTALGWLVSTLVTLGLVFSLMGAWRKQAGFRPTANDQLPATSWIAMSLNPKHSGQYNYADFESVNRKPTAAAKNRRTAKMIRGRLKQMGVTGTAVHLTKKMRVFWATGDFDSFKLTTQWIKAPRFYVTGQRNIQFWLVIMTQVIYLTLLIEAIIVLVTARTLRPGPLFIALTILGLTAFHVVFWEVEPRYALPLLPGLMLLGVIGICERPQWVLTPRTRKVGLAAMSGLAVFSLLSLWQTSQRTLITHTTVAVQGNGNYVENTHRTLKPEQSVTQTIKTAGRSNRLSLSPLHNRYGLVNVQIEAGGRVIFNQAGTPRDLQSIRYPTTRHTTLRVTITNLGLSTVSYGTAEAPYNPLNGKITPHSRSYLQYSVQEVHPPRTLSGGLVSTLIAVVFFGGALPVLKRLPISSQAK